MKFTTVCFGRCQKRLRRNNRINWAALGGNAVRTDGIFVRMYTSKYLLKQFPYTPVNTRRFFQNITCSFKR